MKHRFNQDYILEGKIYKSINGIVDLPVEIESLNPIFEEVKTEDEKELLILKCVELGLGNASTLKRNSIDTLKKKIEEA